MSIEVASMVRHGMYDPFGKDGGLDVGGKKEIQSIAEQLKGFFDLDILSSTVLMSATWRRTIETAEILADTLGLVVVTNEILNVYGNRHAPREKVLETIQPSLADCRGIVVAGQDYMVTWLAESLHPSGKGGAYLNRGEAIVVTGSGEVHKLKP